jgi:hypothetical protein
MTSEELDRVLEIVVRDTSSPYPLPAETLRMAQAAGWETTIRKASLATRRLLYEAIFEEFHT